jgi:hypothetical protein
MKLTKAKVLFSGVALVFGGLLVAGCSSSSNDTTTTPEVPNLRGRVMLASPARAVAAPGAEMTLDGVATGEFTDNQGDFAMKVEPGQHTLGIKDVRGTIGIVLDDNDVAELEIEVQDNGNLIVQEDLNRDGVVNRDDDANNDNQLNDDNDNAADDNGIGEDNDNEIPDAPENETDNTSDNTSDNTNDNSGK